MGRGRPVDAGERAEIVHRRTRAQRREIGADIDHGSHTEADEAVIRIERELGVRDVVAPVIVAQMPFRALAHPADRPAEPARRPQRQQIFRIDVGLDPEAAADIVDLDVDALLVDPEDTVGEQRAHDEGVLDRRAQEQAARAWIVVGETAARLHRIGEHAGQQEAALYDIARVREGGVRRRAVADLVNEAFVVRATVEHDRRAVVEQVGGPRYRGEGFVVDRDTLGGVLRPIEALRDDEDHAVADVARMAPGERKIRRARGRLASAPFHRRTDMGDRAEPVGDIVFRGENGGDARHGESGGDVYVCESRVGVRGPQDVTPQRPVQIRARVVREKTAPRQQRGIFQPRHRLPDAELAHRNFRRLPGRRAVSAAARGCSRSWRRRFRPC